MRDSEHLSNGPLKTDTTSRSRMPSQAWTSGSSLSKQLRPAFRGRWNYRPQATLPSLSCLLNSFLSIDTVTGG